MIFKTRKQFESVIPFTREPDEKFYTNFEVFLNVGIYHLDLEVNYEDGEYHIRIITYNADQVAYLNQDPHIKIISIHYQSERVNNSYKFGKVSAINALKDNVEVVFEDGRIVYDSFFKASHSGNIYKVKEKNSL